MSPETQNTQDTICKTQENQEQGRPTCGYFIPPQNRKQNTHGRVTETKFRAKMKGWTIQRLPHLGIHPIISLRTFLISQKLNLFQPQYRSYSLDILCLCELFLVPKYTVLRFRYDFSLSNFILVLRRALEPESFVPSRVLRLRSVPLCPASY